jgi:hypothetical protein
VWDGAIPGHIGRARALGTDHFRPLA